MSASSLLMESTPSAAHLMSIGGTVGSSDSGTLFLDPSIRDWVVLPLFVIMVVAGLLRGWVGQYLAGPYEKTKAIPSQNQDLLTHWPRAIKSGAAHYMTTTRWHIRRLFVIQQLTEAGDACIELHAKKQEENAEDGGGDDDPMSAMMNNPMGMLKGNMVFMVQNMVMMQGIQHFFSGFIMLKIPFALTAGFKTMFQKGLADSMPDLDPSYVSSVSWYFLTMYGLRGFFKLVMGGEPLLEVREQEITLRQMGLAPPNPNPQASGKSTDLEEWARKFQKEAENMELFLTQHTSEMDQVEKRLLGAKYPKRKSKAAGGKAASKQSNSDFLLGKSGGSSKRKTQ
mmetsp:Transcript_1246/g.2736  ORF Transcript_1246/g.2736 Transcript_1246/m.2736 type:complete len:340 (-) Transcript_1246:1304-2323(-)|eukprot:CAMPEP_0172465566 /NCGR_PEP_ID=MMETSP1065-20121228/53912_1 /TAXON_ID=265537 /ORGANISM="Amphiprora paludosa, Strain CCMP125" /LENGTH=339 /DNA_ID=CAMNT_0013222137 /DNA_START=151 /DNA_END=1170 /DNA_ORIENTATION=-